MPALRRGAPIEHGAFEGGIGAWVGYPRARLLIAEGGKFREFAAAPFADLLGEFRLEIGEEGKGLHRAPFLAHEDQRYLRREEIDGCRDADRFRCRQAR